MQGRPMARANNPLLNFLGLLRGPKMCPDLGHMFGDPFLVLINELGACLMDPGMEPLQPSGSRNEIREASSLLFFWLSPLGDEI